MRKYVYICLMLPALNLSALSGKQTKRKRLELKTAAEIIVKEKDYGGSFHKGSCYIFDETEPALVLKNVKFQVDPKNELIVDFHLSAKEQKALAGLSKKYSKDRHLVTMVNNQIISVPFLKEVLKAPDRTDLTKEKA